MSLKSNIVFTRFVEIGRIILITRGSYMGKIAAIVDVIDQNRLLIDGPTLGVPRMPINMKRVKLTDFKVKFPHTAKTTTVKKVLEVADISDKWKKSSWAIKLDMKKKRMELNDFQRYKLKRLKQTKSRLIKTEINKLKRAKRILVKK